VKLNSSALNSYLYLGEYDKFLQSLPANNVVYTLFYRGLAEYYLSHIALAENYFDRAYQLDPARLPSPIGKAISETLKHNPETAGEVLRATEARIDEQGCARSGAHLQIGASVCGEGGFVGGFARAAAEHRGRVLLLSVFDSRPFAERLARATGI
jgi:hypothetical protein